MPITTLRELALGDLLLSYHVEQGSNEAPGIRVIPTSKARELAAPTEHLDEPAINKLPASWLPIRAWEVDPIVHIHRTELPAAGAFSQGRTLRGGPSTENLHLVSQELLNENDKTIVRTTLSDGCGLRLVHSIAGRAGCLTVQTVACNTSAVPITLGLLTSFSLGFLSPFTSHQASLIVHRFRSAWSAEGRLVSESLAKLHLSASWSGHGVRCERFGQLGSLPTNGWFPRVAVEDPTAGVTWAAQLAIPGSWQLELYHRANQLAISGGLADREFGHWTKTLAPGESFSAPEALLTVVAGDINAACDRLNHCLDEAFAAAAPEIERGLPIVFNEWCTSWGNPDHTNLIALADRLKNSGVTYLVIDDGWAWRPGPGIQQNGDWKVNKMAFPHGLKATADAIRKRGLIPGLWFEFEVCNPGSAAWEQTAHHLHRDGRPLQVGTRRFWDFRDPWVHEYLTQKVTVLLQEAGIGYLKVDYNDSIGLGCDGAESLGEGLRQHLAGVQRFFRSLREAMPDLVIENCSSGGHRLEPSMMTLAAMSSATDAHETPEIPLIAANLLQLIPSRQNQHWAVLRRDDSPQRLVYSLAATFLGRMCLSGDVHGLSHERWALVLEAISLYRDAAPVIANGTWRRYGVWGEDWRPPAGWQILLGTTQERILAVWHRFGGPQATAHAPIPDEARILRSLSDSALPVHAGNGRILITDERPFSGGVALLACRSCEQASGTAGEDSGGFRK